jgi:hypothetical protein
VALAVEQAVSVAELLRNRGVRFLQCPWEHEDEVLLRVALPDWHALLRALRNDPDIGATELVLHTRIPAVGHRVWLTSLLWSRALRQQVIVQVDIDDAMNPPLPAEWQRAAFLLGTHRDLAEDAPETIHPDPSDGRGGS